MNHFPDSWQWFSRKYLWAISFYLMIHLADVHLNDWVLADFHLAENTFDWWVFGWRIMWPTVNWSIEYLADTNLSENTFERRAFWRWSIWPKVNCHIFLPKKVGKLKSFRKHFGQKLIGQMCFWPNDYRRKTQSVKWLYNNLSAKCSSPKSVFGQMNVNKKLDRPNDFSSNDSSAKSILATKVFCQRNVGKKTDRQKQDFILVGWGNLFDMVLCKAGKSRQPIFYVRNGHLFLMS